MKHCLLPSMAIDASSGGKNNKKKRNHDRSGQEKAMDGAAVFTNPGRR